MSKLFLPLVLVLSTLSVFAQKKPLDHSVYDGWQHVGERLISHDGRWIVYTIDPQEGDNELVVRNAEGTYQHRIPRGYNALITEDSRFLVCRIRPFYCEIREARIRKKKPEDQPRDSLLILELGKTESWKRAGVKNYKTPAKGAGWVAFQLEKPIEQPGKKMTIPVRAQDRVTDSLRKVIDSLTSLLESPPARKKKKDGEADFMESRGDEFYGYTDADGDEPAGGSVESGNDLVVRSLSTGEERVFYKVLEYYFSRRGEWLLMEQARNPLDSFSLPQVVLYFPEKDSLRVLSRGGNDFRQFAFSEDGSRLAWLAERDARPKDLQKFYRLWYYNTGMDSAALLLDRNTVGMKLGMTISEHGTLSFSKSGQRLFFGVAPIAAPRDTSLAESEQPRLDIWHYQDDYLQTVQTLPARLRAAQQENYLSVYDFTTARFVTLGSRELPQVQITGEGDGEWFAAQSDWGKRVESQWNGFTRRDVYAVHATTGEKRLLKANLHGMVYAGAAGKAIAWYDRSTRQYMAWNGRELRSVSDKIKVPLWNEESDVPDAPGNYGVMGWHEGDSALYVYDRFDIWKLPVMSGAAPVNITGVGRSAQQRIRYISTDPEQRFFREGQTVFYKGTHQVTKEEELMESSLKDWFSYESVYRCACSMGPVTKARQASSLLYTRETFRDNPDLYLHTLQPNTPEEAVRLTSLNPRQSDYLWGTAELFRWKAYNGKDATGIVYKPEDFDPRKKYPMVIYFYEKLSDGLFDYKEPAPIRSAVNIPFFVSRGYVVFLPDIEYKTGYPGQSAYDYIVSGARALVKKGWADSTRIGIQGHSWGGYQAAQLATMTTLFKAVWAGAPVANMTSAYGGIRWETGISRQFQYEKSQSRIGGTLWEKLPLYLLNSPLFHLNKVTAPMVILHNDADGAVPWYQGIELFTGLRRLGKPVWMFNYNGQGHGLTQRHDMRDYQIRMQQFFDWQLKGEKPARWITEGVPALRKGKDWGLETVD